MGTPASGCHPHPVVHPKVHLFIVLQHESLDYFDSNLAIALSTATKRISRGKSKMKAINDNPSNCLSPGGRAKPCKTPLDQVKRGVMRLWRVSQSTRIMEGTPYTRNPESSLTHSLPLRTPITKPDTITAKPDRKKTTNDTIIQSSRSLPP